MRRLGFLLVGLAFVFMTTIVPWHFHEDSAPASTSHCTVCHFSKEARSGTPEVSLSFEAPSNDGTVVESPVLRTFYSEIHTPASSRAPPSV